MPNLQEKLNDADILNRYSLLLSVFQHNLKSNQGVVFGSFESVDKVKKGCSEMDKICSSQLDVTDLQLIVARCLIAYFLDGRFQKWILVGGAFLSSGLQVFFDRIAPQGELLKMFQKRKNDVRILKKLKVTLRGLQAVVSDVENKQESNQSVSQWLDELPDAVKLDGRS
ncbi:hypothetical protein MTR67_048880 [Solanum verrucosum]|uniref:Disease resistance N-terminal domain-containing protein n=1 Tax=Solanum verrucosum TaxID=315347 RepID=A0AAF0UZ89_SOLVR|nr:hypothetical protein MTR67_048880 [Solanum verrucosum]